MCVKLLVLHLFELQWNISVQWSRLVAETETTLILPNKASTGVKMLYWLNVLNKAYSYLMQKQTHELSEGNAM